MAGPITVNVAVRFRFWTLPTLRALQIVGPYVVPRRMHEPFIGAVAAFIVRFGVRTEVSR